MNKGYISYFRYFPNLLFTRSHEVRARSRNWFVVLLVLVLVLVLVQRLLFVLRFVT